MKTYRLPFAAMASRCEVVVAAQDEATARRWAGLAIEEVARIECKFSRYRDDSIITRINRAAGGPAVECDDETLALLEFCDALYRNSDGLFDITSGVLRRAWNFANAVVPDDASLQALQPLIGWPKVEREQRHVRLPQAGMEIDFGGFGKEYAADRAATAMQGAGAGHGYVNLAGDLRVFGPRPGGEPWQIGIQDPRQSDQLVATIPVASGGLATSGDYERFFERDGRRYCHILDPRNGLPVTHWRTVSVLAPLAVVAGNCSTIAMLKQAEGLAFLEQTGMSFLAVDQSGQCFTKGTRT